MYINFWYPMATSDEVRRTGERKQYAVPGPGRRDSANWVVDEIPRLSAA